MKQTMIALFLLPLFLAPAACKKDDGSGTTPTEDSTQNPALAPDRISKISRQDAAGTTVTRITYSGNYTVDSIVEEGGSYTAAFKHAGIVTTKITLDPPSTTYDTLVFDGAGRLTEIHTKTGNARQHRYHFYDSEGRRVRTAWEAPYFPYHDTTHYTWSGGNLVEQSTNSMGFGRLSYTFYSDKAFAAGDMMYLDELRLTGRVPKRGNANLCRTINYHTVAGTDTVSYTFSGTRVTGRRNTFQPMPYTETYEYLPK